MRAPDFWHKDGATARALSPLGALYGASVALKAALARPYRAPVPVICVGNLTAGGSGKTPVAIAVARLIAARRPFFLTRGYGGTARGPLRVRADHSAALVGDEALLLARHAPTILARDRAEGAALAVTEGAGALVMDDGHQNFTLFKNLRLVVVDGESGFGNGRVIPAGSLREPIAQGLKRADAVVVMGDGAPGLGDFAGPVLRARLETDAGAWKSREVFAFAGIGRPQKFFDSLIRAGVVVKESRAFGDHHFYTPEEIAALRARAGALPLVTTEKDFVRLPLSRRGDIAALAAQVRFEQPDALQILLDGLA